MEADEIYTTNYLDSVKIAQRCVYFGFLISAFVLLVIDLPKGTTGIKVPLINMELQSPQSALIILAALYFLNSLLMSFSIRNATRNKQKISREDIQNAVSHFPLTLTSKGIFGIVVFFGLAAVNMVIYTEGFNFAWYVGWPLGTLTAWGYWDAFNEARNNLSHA